jgi:hypothetical protein
MHAHLLAEDRLGDQPALYIANGVTGVRVMGSALLPSQILKVRTAFGIGETMGPRLGAVRGRMLENANGRPDAVFLPIATVEDARRAVAGHKKEGADFIKCRSAVATMLGSKCDDSRIHAMRNTLSSLVVFASQVAPTTARDVESALGCS